MAQAEGMHSLPGDWRSAHLCWAAALHHTMREPGIPRSRSRARRSLPALPLREQIHQVARAFAVGFVLERDVEVGRGAEHVEQGP